MITNIDVILLKSEIIEMSKTKLDDTCKAIFNLFIEAVFLKISLKAKSKNILDSELLEFFKNELPNTLEQFKFKGMDNIPNQN